MFWSNPKHISNMNLNYHLIVRNPKSAHIILDIFDAERYSSAVVVQQLVGNLVYFSNQGRYEPRIAESWQQVEPTKWIFNLHTHFKCENGEEINPLNFKKSLERLILSLSAKSRLPVFSKLKGYDSFLKDKNSITGLVANGNKLEFHFNEPTKTGLLEMLSYAPFGYICKDNFNEKNEWKDPSKFISSGPYRVKDITIGSKYVLEKRQDWPFLNSKSPQQITITTNLDSFENGPTIVDSFSILENIPKSLKPYSLVPEYLNTIALGNFNSGYFKEFAPRKLLQATIEKSRHILPNEWSTHRQSSSFFPSQQKTNNNFSHELNFTPPKSPLIIGGSEPIIESAKWFSWQILKKALDELKWPYRFSESISNWSESVNSNYDIRLLGPSVGAGFEVWSINVNFCATIGMNLPDPTGRICNMLESYEDNKITDDQAQDMFFKIIEEDVAILPISHYGLQWYVSKEIDRNSISPLINVIRFDNLNIED
jgi:hypothetical protein